LQLAETAQDFARKISILEMHGDPVH
jgi:hypothetical protein